jgi:hypothetical protein
VIPLEGGRSGLKLTIASFWRPSEQNIHRRRNATEKDVWGVMPSAGYEVKLDDSELVEVMQRRRERDVVQPPGATTAGPQAPKTAEKPENKPDEATQNVGKLQGANAPDGKGEDSGDPQLNKAVEAIEQEIAAAVGNHLAVAGRERLQNRRSTELRTVAAPLANLAVSQRRHRPSRRERSARPCGKDVNSVARFGLAG